MDEDTTCILGEFVDQTNRRRVTDTSIGRVSVQSETDNLKPIQTSQIPVRKREEIYLSGIRNLHTSGG